MKDILQKQLAFEKVIGVPIETLLETERNQMSEIFIFKMIEEAIEARKEFPSVMNKWSKSQKNADISRVQEELSDVFVFFLNLLLVWHIDWDDFLDIVRCTQQNNFTKIKEKKLKMYNEELLNIPGYTTGIGQGNVNPKYVFVGQNPGKDIAHGYKVWSDPTSGSSKVLLPLLQEQQILENCYFTNLVKCTTDDNREPTEGEADFWMPHLIDELVILSINNKDLKVIAMGKWTQNAIGKLATAGIPHPSWALRDASNADTFKFELLNALRLQPILPI